MPTLHWVGKEAVLNHHEKVPFHLLNCDPSLSVGDPDSGNLLIEGDNLLALKALLPYYAGKVKCIYIDPPYNTGNESWVYNDNVNSPDMRDWLGKVVGKEVEDLSRHDKWLCMMYPRLVLAEKFLHEEGAIFISIDDIELASLRMFLDDYFFGRMNFLACFVWETEGNYDNQAKVKIAHEYILAYTKNGNNFSAPPVVDPNIDTTSKLFRTEIRNTIVKNGPKNPISSITLPVGFPANFQSGTIKRRIDSWPHYEEDLIVEDYKLKNSVAASSGWSSGRIFKEFINSGFLTVFDTKKQATRFELTETGAIEAVKKRSDSQSYVVSTLRNIGSTQQASATLRQMGIKFAYPKPTRLIKYLIKMISDTDALVLDFFAGSGTTGQAVLQANEEDGGSRKFIMIEMEQEVAQPITQQRLQRVIAGYAFKGMDRTELLREKLTVTNFKSSAKIVARMDALKEDYKDNFDGFETKIANDYITFNGKRKIDGFKEGVGGGFRYCHLGETLFDADGNIRETVSFVELARHVFFSETGSPLSQSVTSPLIGTFKGTAIYLLYNGILHDAHPDGGNILTRALLAALPAHDGPKVFYANGSLLAPAYLQQHQISFRQTPYQIEVR